jgi:glycerophosphoryl diester phosphodiesterase
MDPTIPLGLICETQSQLSLWRQLPVEYVIPHYNLVRQDLISEVKGTERKVFVWTVNAAADMKSFSDWGVDGVISDNAERLAITLRRAD